MTNYQDLSGKRFGKLVAVKITFAEKGKKTKWLCHCDCGNEKEIAIDSLKSGKTKSCGCYRKYVTRKSFEKHGMANDRLYQIWQNMKERCYNKNRKSYKDYGERGIVICDSWLDFSNFKEWSFNNGYKDDLTIDRINVNGIYEPSNCRWADRITQNNNTTKNVFFEINGVTRTLAQHARYYGINYYTLHFRYNEMGLRNVDLIKGKTEVKK